MRADRLQFNPDRRGAERCACGERDNKDGKFAPFVGFTDKGHCFSCGKTFFPDANGETLLRRKKVPELPAHASLSHSTIPEDVLRQSLGLYGENLLVRFFRKLTDGETAARLVSDYRVGTSRFWPGSAVFWLVDREGKVRDGKIIQYEERTDSTSCVGTVCSRVKGNVPPVKWVSKLMRARNFKLAQCFFGEHLLRQRPGDSVAVVESEKTALIAAAYHPRVVWLACGGADGLTDTKAKALEGRNVTLWPDLGKFDLWKKRAARLRSAVPGLRLRVADLLERVATEEERKRGLDLADYLVRYDWSSYKKV